MRHNFIKITLRSLSIFPLLLLLLNSLYAQKSVGIGTVSPDGSAALDIFANDKGLLIPRVSLQSISDIATIATPATSILVYNTNDAIAGGAGSGYYFNAGTPQVANWVKLMVFADNQSWLTKGNSGLNNTNYLGTNDEQDLTVKRGGVTAFKILKGGTFFATGNVSEGIAPSGPGTRMVWAPAKAAFRTGSVSGNQWDDANIGKYSFATGFNTLAKGDYSVAMGYATTAGYSAVAFGYNTEASGDFSVTFGYQTKGTGGSSVAMGYQTLASGSRSVATGFATQATGAFSFTANNSTVAGGLNASAFGEFTDARITDQFVVGRYNELKNAIYGARVPTDRLFVIGGGTADNIRKDVFYVQRNGNAYVAGDLTVVGMINPSDIRLKEDIKPLENVLQKIDNIQPISYYFKDKNLHPASHQIGFSAQEIENAFPELVKKNEEGFLGVNYGNMTAVTFQAIKEQQEIIEAQQNEIKFLVKNLTVQKTEVVTQAELISKLKQINADLESRISNLEKIAK